MEIKTSSTPSSPRAPFGLSPTDPDYLFLASTVPKTEMAKTSFPKNKIKILLLENVHSTAVEHFEREGFSVKLMKGAMTEEELCAAIKDVHALGIRSKTRVTAKVLESANRLLCIGCFCIGTDQVDLEAAQKNGIPVFNSPFCNSRSVAELIIAEIIMLSRRLGDKVMQMHNGTWDKSAANCYEIRGKTLGIVGYGHIGTQLSVLAESMGMKVIFYDIENKLPLGNSRRCSSLKELLKEADYVTLHVPQTEQTKQMIGESEIAQMKKGSYLLNASRGQVVVLEAMAEALKSGHLLGAAVDVYPTEPVENIKSWECILKGCPNTILTPHIGGSTEEAQYAIGKEVTEKIIRVINTGSTQSSVNFPPIDLPYGGPKTHRILNIHKNVPGVLKNINCILGEFNVHGQICATAEHIGYLIVDVEKEASEDIKKNISVLPSSLRTRILY